jgi:hypothetical protein
MNAWNAIAPAPLVPMISDYSGRIGSGLPIYSQTLTFVNVCPGQSFRPFPAVITSGIRAALV